MIRMLAATACVAAALASGQALAQVRPPSPDTNKDGFVSKAEHVAVTQSRFKLMDVNDDGVIDKAEQGRVARFVGGRNPLGPADGDQDGKVTRAEFAAATTAQFARGDLDKDGRLSASEQAAMRAARARR